MFFLNVKILFFCKCGNIDLLLVFVNFDTQTNMCNGWTSAWNLFFFCSQILSIIVMHEWLLCFTNRIHNKCFTSTCTWFTLELCFVHIYACIRFNYCTTFCDGYKFVGEKSQLILWKTTRYIFWGMKKY